VALIRQCKDANPPYTLLEYETLRAGSGKVPFQAFNRYTVGGNDPISTRST
jgi:hypothetical protein